MGEKLAASEKPAASPPPARAGLRVAFWRFVFCTPIADRILKRRAAHLIEQSGIQRHIKADGMYLDVGSGSGHFVERIVRKNSDGSQRFVAFDPSWRPTYWVRRRLRLRSPGRVLFMVADGLKIPVADGAFDGASLCFVLHHVPYEGQAAILKEIGRALKPGGLLFLIEDTPDAPNEWATHVNRDRKLNLEPADEPHFYRSGAEWRTYLAEGGWTLVEETYFEELADQPIPIRHRAFVLRHDGLPAAATSA